MLQCTTGVVVLLFKKRSESGTSQLAAKRLALGGGGGTPKLAEKDLCRGGGRTSIFLLHCLISCCQSTRGRGFLSLISGAPPLHFPQPLRSGNFLLFPPFWLSFPLQELRHMLCFMPGVTEVWLEKSGVGWGCTQEWWEGRGLTPPPKLYPLPRT